MATTSTASQVPGLRQISSQTIINRLSDWSVTQHCHGTSTLSWHGISLKGLQWHQEHIWWRHAQWRTVLFSNESHIMLFRVDGRSRIYWHHNEHNTDNCVLEHDFFGGSGAMVWAGIHYDGRTALLRVNGMFNAQIYLGWDTAASCSTNSHLWWYLSAWQCQATHCIITLPTFSTAKQRSCLTMASKIGRFIPKRTPLGHLGLQSSSKESQGTNTTGTVLSCTEWMAIHPPMHYSKSFCFHTSFCADVIAAQGKYNWCWKFWHSLWLH